jgi:hypothetical protein
MTVKKISKNMVAEVYLEDVMQALTATGNVCMQHLRARTNARTSFILCLPVGSIAFKHDGPRPIVFGDDWGYRWLCVCFCFVHAWVCMQKCRRKGAAKGDSEAFRTTQTRCAEI